MEWSTACPDWRTRIVEKQPLIALPPLYPQEAEDGLRVFHELRLPDVPGQPLMRDATRPWFNDFVASIFGAYDPETGRRMITKFFLLISKKNMKSTGAAGIMLTALLRNWRPNGEFLILAPTIEIANNAYQPARDMIKADEELSELLHVQDHIRMITHRTTGATLKVVAADNETVGGKKAIGVLVDELWLFGKRPNAENMLLEATGGLASRPEGFVIYLSTQSDEPPAGVFAKELRLARDVRDGKVRNPRLLPVIYEYPEEMVKSKAYLDPSTWYIPNPNLGASVDEQYLQDKLADPGSNDSSNGVLAKHLNIEIGLSLRSDRWPGADWWERRGDSTLRDIGKLIELCEVIAIGIDGGGLDDLLGLAAIGRKRGTDVWLGWFHAWASPMVLKRRQQVAAQLEDYAKDGDVTIVEGLPDDVTALVSVVKRVFDSGKLCKVAMDPTRIGVVKSALETAKIPEELLVGVSQGWRLTGPIVVLERRLAEGTFMHGGTRMMAWSTGNARVEQRGNALLVTKAASGSAKIDPLMAGFCAVEVMSMNPQAPGRSFWETT